jgi:hypothetical protein
MTKKKKLDDADILRLAKERFDQAKTADLPERELALDDLRFLNGKQWDDDVRNERELYDRPTLTINKVAAHLDQVVAAERKNRPNISVHPSDAKATIQTAEIMGGMLRHSEQISVADTVYDHAFEHQAACGRGGWRVSAEYLNKNSFRQTVVFRKINNFFTVFFDHLAQEYTREDARWIFVVGDMDEEKVIELNGGTRPTDWGEAPNQKPALLGKNGTVRVCEYFLKEFETIKIYLLDDNRVVEKPQKEDVVVDSREVETWKVVRRLLTGDGILETTEIAGKYIPIIPAWGKEINIDGEVHVRGLIRWAKDPNRLLNYDESAQAESVSMIPKAPYILSSTQLGEYAGQWNDANKKNWPYLLYKPDPQAGGPPKRIDPPQASSGIIESMRIHDQDIRDTTGQQQASMGMTSNEKSGVAIAQRKQEGNEATFAFPDNLSRSIAYSGRVAIEMMRVIHDLPQKVRVVMPDGKSDFRDINQEEDPYNPDKPLNRLDEGEYALVATAGPSYATQRQETADTMLKLLQAIPIIGQIAPDLIVKNMDFPGAPELAGRLQKMVPPQLLSKEELEQKNKDNPQAEENASPGGPPAGPGGAPAPPPDPRLELDLAHKKALIDQEMTRTEGLKLDNEHKKVKTKQQVIQHLQDLAGGGEASAGGANAG